jgi:glycosyltransferase involved in cell wall biosynthesis
VSKLRIAIDAANLPNDKRGMGRIVRGYIALWSADPALEVTLLGRSGSEERAIAAEFASRPVRTARAATARERRAYDCAWFPWNGMRFEAAAPALLTVNDAFAFMYPHREPIARWREQEPIRRGARRATRISTPSHWSGAEIERRLAVPAARISVIAYAPDAYWTARSGPSETLLEAARGRRTVLAVGLREERKNALLLVEAAARALRAPEERLIVVGEISAEAKALLEARAVPHAIVRANDAELRTLYRQATLVAVPSLAEGFGLVAVEAMACGAPVLAANAASLPEATGGAALLLDPRDPAAWAQAIRRVFDDPAYRAELAARSAGRFATCDRERPARETLALLRSLSLEA